MCQIWRCSNVNMISATSRVLLCFIEKCKVNIFQNISFFIYTVITDYMTIFFL